MTSEEEAIEILRAFGTGGVTIADSGGKDSSVLKDIAIKAHEQYGIPIKFEHSHTGLDAPETVYFVRDEKKRLEAAGYEYHINYPEMTFEQLCMKKGMLPTRIARFCCEYLKENVGHGEKLVTGVRKAESSSRKANQGYVTIIDTSKKKRIEAEVDDENFLLTGKGGVVALNYDNAEVRRTVEMCYRTHKTLINPLINWSDDDVWKYIRDNNIKINPLYECGFNRVGCIGCPMARYNGRIQQFARYPKYRERFIRLADRLVELQKQKKGDEYRYGQENGLKYFKRWLEDPNVDGQFSFDMDGNITEDYT